MPPETPSLPPHIEISDAESLQKKLAKQILCEDHFNDIKTVTGVDVAYSQDTDHLVAAAVTLDSTSFEPIERRLFVSKTQFPYIPGLFSFREVPPVVEAIKKLTITPDLIICDGHGIAHPRRFGLASHLGIITHIPTIGCAKTRLYGQQDGPLGPERGDQAFLVDDNNDILGAVLRTQKAVKPVYVSVGHMISLQTACAWVLKCATHYRLPETTRQADHDVRKRLKAF